MVKTGFLVSQYEDLRARLYERNVTCELITEDDLLSGNIKIDVVHTTDHCIAVLEDRLDFIKKYLPNAAWVSSTFDPGSLQPLGIKPKNVVRFLPAIYENLYATDADVNACNMYRHKFEFELLGVDCNKKLPREGFACFNHNFAVRAPEFHEAFSQIRQILSDNNITTLENYGGNIRGHGADIKYHQEGPTGTLKTLSPRDAALKFKASKAVVHF